MKIVLKSSLLSISLILSLIYKPTIAQNYEAMKTAGEYFFIDTVYNRQLAIRIDSTAQLNGTEFYYNFKQIRQLTPFECYTPYGKSWLGDPVTSEPDGIYRFNNVNTENGQISDSIIIQTLVGLDVPWIMFRYPGSGDHIEAVVSSIIQMNFLGITDSVKVISLLRKDNLGQVVNDEVNGKQILLSQHHGLVKLPRFDEFPAYTALYSLCGMSNPAVGQLNPTIQSVYDFSPGDEVHTHYNEQYFVGMGGINEYRIKKYLQRIDAPDLSWVAYSTENCFVRVEQTGLQEYTYTNGHYASLDTVFFNSTLGYELSGEPLEPIINDWLYTAEGFIQHGRSAKVLTYDYPYSGSTGSECWMRVAVDGTCDPYFISGLGGPYYNCPSNIFSNTLINEVTYFKKGNETWGSPFDCDSLLKVGLPEEGTEKGFSLTPNPAHQYATIELAGNQRNGILELFDLTGKEAAAFPIDRSHLNIDLSGLPPGMYIYRFISDNGKQFPGKLIRQ
ncbi:MAG: T9SS type A sorting domain-containing protein [Bacteroidetes bacterium]|nr:T9SS type A sorting domain-containing protein [Bacteroidota bacterium]